MRALRRWLLGCVLLAAAACAGGYAAIKAMNFPGPLVEAQDIIVPRGDTRAVATALEQAGVIRSAIVFRTAALFGVAPLHAGEFAFPAHASVRETLAILRGALPVQHRLTIPEGWTAHQIQAALNADPHLAGPTPPFAEGALLPQTYFFVLGTTRESLSAKARAAMTRALDQAWSGRAPGLPLADADALRTVASIVERETARDDERPMVAAVLLNRLKLGMRLQSDPTVIFAVSGGTGSIDRKLSRADLGVESPFNTYWTAALPPGPICAPGLASLRAAANPAQTDALYFVADGSGGHAFSKTLSEHNRNVTRLRASEGATAP